MKRSAKWATKEGIRREGKMVKKWGIEAMSRSRGIIRKTKEKKNRKNRLKMTAKKSSTRKNNLMKGKILLRKK